MASCQISNILSTIGSTNASDLNPWCAGQYNNNKSFSLGEGMSCSVSSSMYPNYPKGTVFSCQKGSFISFVKNPDGTFNGSDGNKYTDQGGGNFAIVKPPPPPPPPEPIQEQPVPAAVQDQIPAPAPIQNQTSGMSPTMIMIIIVVVLLLGGGAFMFMRKPKVNPMVAFGRKIAKISRMRR